MLSALIHNYGDVFAEIFFTAEAQRAQRKLFFSFAFERKANEKQSASGRK
jgi:hypothetical protein